MGFLGWLRDRPGDTAPENIAPCEGFGFRSPSTSPAPEARQPSCELPYATSSLCPECRKVIGAKKFIENGMVWMEKSCPAHGYYKELLSPDADIYMSIFRRGFIGAKRAHSGPAPSESCPASCGLCGNHASNTALANLDLTNQCDMRCPVCFANASMQGYLVEPDFTTVEMMLRNLRMERPIPVKVIQFSGGEPTLHPRFFDILSLSAKLGFWHIQIATNGKNMSRPEFAAQAKAAGLHTLYLQFDGITDEIQWKTRAEKVMEWKLKVIDNCRKNGLRIVLVPTIIRGVNDSQVGNIVRFAIANSDVVTGISFQPVSFTGRINHRNRLEKRYTLTHLAMDIERQTGYLQAKEWFPIPCTSPFSQLSTILSGEPAITVSCHPDCGAGSFLFIEPKEKKEVKAVTDFFDFEQAVLDLQGLANRLGKRNMSIKLFSQFQILNILKKYFRHEDAPKDLTFRRMLGVLDGYKDHCVGRAKKADETTSYNTIFVAGMHFQDLYNFDLERVRQCVIHYTAQDGGIYPFCSYNSGPCHRDKIELRYRTSFIVGQRRLEITSH